LKEQATEVAVLVMERLPSLAKQQKEVLSGIIEMIFFNMVLTIFFADLKDPNRRRNRPRMGLPKGRFQ
jgi:hypothetical protein